MQKIHIGCGPLTNTIYAGSVLKNHNQWGANKQDVTMSALLAVVQHAQNFGGPIEISRADGTGVEYRITVEKIEEK